MASVRPRVPAQMPLGVTGSTISRGNTHSISFLISTFDCRLFLSAQYRRSQRNPHNPHAFQHLNRHPPLCLPPRPPITPRILTRSQHHRSLPLRHPDRVRQRDCVSGLPTITASCPKMANDQLTILKPSGSSLPSPSPSPESPSSFIPPSKHPHNLSSLPADSQRDHVRGIDK